MKNNDPIYVSQPAESAVAMFEVRMERFEGDPHSTRYDVYELGRADEPNYGHTDICADIQLDTPLPFLEEVFQEGAELDRLRRVNPQAHGVAVALLSQARRNLSNERALAAA